MSLFDDAIAYCENESSSFDKIVGNVNSFYESALQEYEDNIKMVDEKIITESGTEEDRILLYEAASEGLVNKAIRCIKKLIESLFKFLSNMADKVASLFNSDSDLSRKLDKVDDLTKDNKELGKEKITYTCPITYAKAADKSCAELEKLATKVKHGKYSPKLEDELDAINENNDKRLKVAKGVTATVAVSAVAALIGVFATKVKNAKSSEDAPINESDLNRVKDTEAGSAKIGLLQKIMTSWCNTKKSKTSNFVLSISELKTGLGNTLHDIRAARTGVAVPNPEVEESVDELSLDDNFTIESVDTYLDDIYASVMPKFEKSDDEEDCDDKDCKDKDSDDSECDDEKESKKSKKDDEEEPEESDDKESDDDFEADTDSDDDKKDDDKDDDKKSKKSKKDDEEEEAPADDEEAATESVNDESMDKYMSMIDDLLADM